MKQCNNRTMKQYIHSGFSLIEILIVVMIFIIISIILLLMFNPTKSRNKLYDSQRKRHIESLRGLYETYFAQHTYYPKGEEICFDTPVQTGSTCSCHICGLAKNKDFFTPIVHVLYCDPEHPIKNYVYEYDCVSEYPQWYKLYTKLTANAPPGPWCNYGVTQNQSRRPLEPYPDTCSTEEGSAITPTPTGGPGGPTSPPTSGTPVPTNTPGPTSTPVPTLPPCPDDPAPKYCLRAGCNNCGTFAECLDPLHPERCDQPILNLYLPACAQACQP